MSEEQIDKQPEETAEQPDKPKTGYFPPFVTAFLAFAATFCGAERINRGITYHMAKGKGLWNREIIYGRNWEVVKTEPGLPGLGLLSRGYEARGEKMETGAYTWCSLYEHAGLPPWEIFHEQCRDWALMTAALRKKNTPMAAIVLVSNVGEDGRTMYKHLKEGTTIDGRILQKRVCDYVTNFADYIPEQEKVSLNQVAARKIHRTTRVASLAIGFLASFMVLMGTLNLAGVDNQPPQPQRRSINKDGGYNDLG